MRKPGNKKILLGSGIALLLLLAIGYWLVGTAIVPGNGSTYIYIDSDDTKDSVFNKIEQAGPHPSVVGLKLICGVMGYDRVRTGCYDIGGGINAIYLYRNLRGGLQSPVKLTIPNVRTIEALSARLALQLEMDSASLSHKLKDEAVCEAFGYDTATIACIFIPNTYEVFWTITPEDLLKRMKKESDKFWTSERLRKAEAAGLNQNEVITLASIVDQETANNAEKPMVAGMYLNRLQQGMKLQADPTVKFALKQFGLRRILHQHLTVDSPYNTYRYEGLPPGPIAIPALSSIEAVLNYARHDYIYMCAKEDFSGTHNFAKTYEEHLANARKYTNALNARNIH